jgi:hypothetical protein
LRFIPILTKDGAMSLCTGSRDGAKSQALAARQAANPSKYLV